MNRWLFLSFSFALALVAQDAREIVVRSIQAGDHSSRLAQSYTYKESEETRELDGAGQVKATHTAVKEVLSIGGKQYRRTLLKDGKPLPPAEAAKERDKLDRAADEASRLSPGERASREADREQRRAKNREMLRSVPEAYQFTLLERPVLNGRPVYKIRAAPTGSYRGKYANVMRNCQGVLWIDEKDYEWVRVEMEVLDTVSFGLFLARVQGGTRVTFEQTRVNDEIWLPKLVRMKAAARVALFKKFNVEQDVTFSEYRKFTTDSRVIPESEAAK